MDPFRQRKRVHFIFGAKSPHPQPRPSKGRGTRRNLWFDYPSREKGLRAGFFAPKLECTQRKLSSDPTGVNFSARIETWFFICLYALLLASLSGCSTLHLSTPTPSPVPTETPQATPTLQAFPLGTPENPVVFGYISDEIDPGNALADRISQLSGYVVAAKPFPAYEPLLEEMRAGSIQVAWMPPFTYILASQERFAQVAVISKHFGLYGYGAQFLSNTADGLVPYFDPSTNQVTGEPSDALVQLGGKRPCWVSPVSASGYVAPLGLLAENEVNVLEGAFLQDHTSVIRALYVRGICDFGATFAVSGDPRTSPVLQDLPDVMTRIQVIWRSESLIPTDGLAMLPELPPDLRDHLTQAFVALAKENEGRALLSAAFNYDIQDFAEVQDSTYDPLRRLLHLSQVDITRLIGK